MGAELDKGNSNKRRRLGNTEGPAEMPEAQQQLSGKEQLGKQAEASAQNLSEFPKNPEYDPDQLQRSFGIVNQESDLFKRECVMHQQAQVMGMTIEEYRRWYKFQQEHFKRFHRVTLPVLRLWQWTGFSEKKLWDILQLLIVPAVLAGGAFYLQEAAKQKDQQLADNRTKQESLNRYFDAMTALLFDKNLRASKPNDEVRTIAQAKTLTILAELSSNRFSAEELDYRKKLILQFLQKTQLINKDNAVVSLEGANFDHAVLYDGDFSETNLSRVSFGASYLSGANLSNSNLSRARFFSTKLVHTNLRNADLTGAVMFSSNLSEADLTGAIITTEQLDEAKLCHTILPDAKISDRDCKELGFDK